MSLEPSTINGYGIDIGNYKNDKGKSVLFKWNNKVKSSTPKKLKLLHHSNNLIETIIKR